MLRTSGWIGKNFHKKRGVGPSRKQILDACIAFQSKCDLQNSSSCRAGRVLRLTRCNEMKNCKQTTHTTYHCEPIARRGPRHMTRSRSRIRSSAPPPARPAAARAPVGTNQSRHCFPMEGAVLSVIIHNVQRFHHDESIKDEVFHTNDGLFCKHRENFLTTGSITSASRRGLGPLHF